MSFWRAGVLLLSLLLLSGRTVAAEEWKPVTIPDAWKDVPEGEGIYQWYRCRVSIPAAWKGRRIELLAEAVDDAREFYVGGVRIGGFGEFPPRYRSGLGETKRMPIDEGSVDFGGQSLVAVRICINQSRTGFNVAAPVLIAGDEAIRLAGLWEFRGGDDLAWGRREAAADVKTPEFGKVELAADVERQIKRLAGDAGPLSPPESLAKARTPDDLRAEIVLAEPQIGQPLSMKWDARGRLWVVNYLQYPHPAGLKMVSRDKFLRSVYDRVPPAPPHHFPGADKITIHEDTDGDGKLDKHSTFVEGLSLVTSFAFGRGGVWVLNPPYLLFYPDADGDDRPDGDPVVHLEGFGLEDSHSITNNLRFGPDGWLYATQGSTVTGNVKRPGDKAAVHSLGQLVWRYHPDRRVYEIFAEGGGNAFGLEFDDQGRVYSGHNGGNTRGFHYVQGGYYQKGFGKHGALSNPYTFGYFEAMAHHDVPRFTHTFVIYGGGALPARYDRHLFGVAPLLSHVVISRIESDRSSFRTRDVGHALASSDTWFRPVDIQVGPDGAIYVADMYEQRIDHASHYQGRVHKESGRIYRLSGLSDTAPPKFDLARMSDGELVDLLAHPNRWFRQSAQLQLRNRGKNAMLAHSVEAKLRQAAGQLALELLWALDAASGGLSEAQVLAALDHADPYVRLWAVRLACDDGEVSSSIAGRLTELAYREPHVEVRSQLACSARRLPAAQSLPIVRHLASRSEDARDIHIPLLLWWAIEAKADQDRDAVLALFAEREFWNQPLVAEHLVERLMRRYAATGARKDLVTCARLLDLAPSKELAGKLMAGFEAAYEGRTVANLPPELVAAMARAGAASPTLRLRQQDPQAVAEALKTIADDGADVAKRQQLIAIFGAIQQPQCVPVLLKIAKESRNDVLRSAALASLQSYRDESIGREVVALYGNLPDDVRAVALSLLASRLTWSQALLSALDSGQIEKRTIDDATVRKLLLFDSPELTQNVKRHFGELSGPSPEQIRQQIDALLAKLDAGTGNPYRGKQLFVESCGKCHVLFDQGGKIGPDLTSYKRDDLRGMLLNVLNPSAEIREGYEHYVVRTADGRMLSGFIADQDPQVVVIKGVDGQSISVLRDDIEEMRVMPVSLMPDGVLKDFSEQQLRDLFAYLRATQPLPQ
jgi:putative membrane-bound dehydrogenase-like protein